MIQAPPPGDCDVVVVGGGVVVVVVMGGSSTVILGFGFLPLQLEHKFFISMNHISYL